MPVSDLIGQMFTWDSFKVLYAVEQYHIMDSASPPIPVWDPLSLEHIWWTEYIFQYFYFNGCILILDNIGTVLKVKEWEKVKFLQLPIPSALSCQPIQQNTQESTPCGTHRALCWCGILNAIWRVRNRGHFMAGTECIRVKTPYEKLNLFLSEQHNSSLGIQMEREGWVEYCSGSSDSTRIGCAVF